MKKQVILLLGLLFFFAFPNSIKANSTVTPNIYAGIELIELAQNDFKDLGPDNYTFFIGQQFWEPGWEKFGWRVQGINVDISEKEVSRSPMFENEDVEGISGKLSVQQVYLDYYITSWQWKAIKFRPILSMTAGHFNFNLHDREGNSFAYDSIVAGASLRLNTLLFDRFFIDFP